MLLLLLVLLSLQKRVKYDVYMYWCGCYYFWLWLLFLVLFHHYISLISFLSVKYPFGYSVQVNNTWHSDIRTHTYTNASVKRNRGTCIIINNTHLLFHVHTCSSSTSSVRMERSDFVVTVYAHPCHSVNVHFILILDRKAKK